MFSEKTDFSKPNKTFLNIAEGLYVKSPIIRTSLRKGFKKKVIYSLAFLLQNSMEFISGGRCIFLIPYKPSYWKPDKMPDKMSNLLGEYVTFASMKEAVQILNNLGLIGITKGNGWLTKRGYWKSSLEAVESEAGYMTNIYFTHYGILEIKKLLKLEEIIIKESAIIKHKLDIHTPLRYEFVGNQQKTVLKRKKGVESYYNPVPKDFSKEMDKINEFYRENHREIPEPFGVVQLQRIFSESLMFGGRLYAPFQNISKKDRKRIMDENGWNEYDFKALHPTILLKLTETTLPEDAEGDFYLYLAQSMGFPKGEIRKFRPFFKKMFIILTNVLGKKSALKSLRFIIRKERYAFNRLRLIYERENDHELTPEILLSLVEKSIPPKLMQFFYSGIGLIIQRIDSNMIISTLKILQEKNIVAIPIHDAILSKEENMPIIQETMLEVFDSEIHQILNTPNHIFHLFVSQIDNLKKIKITTPRVIHKLSSNNLYCHSDYYYLFETLFSDYIHTISLSGTVKGEDNLISSKSLLITKNFQSIKQLTKQHKIKSGKFNFPFISDFSKIKFQLLNRESEKHQEMKLRKFLTRLRGLVDAFGKNYVKVWV